MYTLYGIKNCDTVKKARKWLDENTIAYQFHDFRTDGLDSKLLSKLEAGLGWENMLNRRSTSWRQLDDKQKKRLIISQSYYLNVGNPHPHKTPSFGYRQTNTDRL